MRLIGKGQSVAMTRIADDMDAIRQGLQRLQQPGAPNIVPVAQSIGNPADWELHQIEFWAAWAYEKKCEYIRSQGRATTTWAKQLPFVRESYIHVIKELIAAGVFK